MSGFSTKLIFVNSNVSDLTTIPLQKNEMVAVMPVNHPLASSSVVSLEELLKDPYILLDEGVIHEPIMILNSTILNLIHNTGYMILMRLVHD